MSVNLAHLSNLSEHVAILVDFNVDLLRRYSSAMRAAEIARARHESLKEIMKPRTMIPTPEQILRLCAGLHNTADLKGDLVEIEACAALVADMIQNEFLRRNL